MVTEACKLKDTCSYIYKLNKDSYKSNISIILIINFDKIHSNIGLLAFFVNRLWYVVSFIYPLISFDCSSLIICNTLKILFLCLRTWETTFRVSILWRRDQWYSCLLFWLTNRWMGKIVEFNDVTKRYSEHYEGDITKLYKLSYLYDMIYYHISFYILVN